MLGTAISYLGQLLQNHLEKYIYCWVKVPKIPLAISEIFFKCLWQ